MTLGCRSAEIINPINQGIRESGRHRTGFVLEPHHVGYYIFCKRQSRKHKLDELGILLITDAERPRQLG